MKEFPKKTGLGLSVALSFALVTSQMATAEQTTVRMWFNGTPDAHGVVLNELIPKFEAQNPDIKVDWELTAWGNYQQRIATAAAGGTLPDIIFGFSNLVAGFADRGLLADHSLYFDPADFVPATVDLTTWNNTWYMLPTWFSANALSYRTDLITEGGNDASSAPVTWDQWQAWAEGATKRSGRTIEQLGFYSSSFGFNRTNLFTRLVESNGGSMFSEDGSKVTFNAPEGIAAAAFFQKLAKCCDERGAIEADNIGLGQGRTAMVYNNFAFREWLKEFPNLVDVGHLAAVPHGPNGSPELSGVGLGANVIGITSRSQNPEAAAKLLRFLVIEPENIVRLAGLGGSIPAALSVDGHPYFDANPWVGQYRDLAIASGSADPAHPNYSEYESILGVWLDELLVNGMDPKRAMDGAAREIQNEIIDRSGVPFFKAGAR